MFRLKLKLNMLDLSKLMLSLLIISINIREPFFHTREILFLLVVLTSLIFIDVKQLKYAVVLVVIWMVSAFYNLLIPGSDFSLKWSGFDTIIVSGYLFLMCFTQARYAGAIIKSYIFASVMVAIITIAIWLLCCFSESYFLNLSYYFNLLKERTGLAFITVNTREIVGTTFLTVWLRTSPCMICALGYCLVERLTEKGIHTILILLFATALVFSGTRANMLCAVLLILLYIAFWFSKKKLALIKWILISAVLMGTISVALIFLNDPISKSSMIKVSDINTYLSIFDSDILRTLFFGWGPGSTFYSVVRGLTIELSELTLFETIRRYGLVSTIVIFFYIWFQPLYILLSKNNLKYKLFYVACLFAFIITACTNPYLLDSVGFCALLFFYTYFKYGTDADNCFS